MAYNPTWLPSWPADAPDYETHYQFMAPRQWPYGIHSEGSESHLDQQGDGILLSWIRKSMWWVMERIWPWLDDDKLFLDRWEDTFGLSPSQDLTTRQRRVVASMRNRGTGTEAVIKAIFEWVLGTTDPADVSIVSPTPGNIWGACLVWRRMEDPSFFSELDFADIQGHTSDYAWAVGPGGEIWLWNGTTWTHKGSGTANNLEGVWGFGEQDAWVVGAASTVRQWSGGLWGAAPAGSAATNWNDVDGFKRASTISEKADCVVLVGDAGWVSRWNGAAWTNTQMAAGAHDFYGVHVFAKDDIWVCGSNGRVYSWDGTSWAGHNPNASVNTFRAIRKMQDTGNVWVVGDAGDCQYYDGSSWNASALGTANAMYGMDGWREDRLVVVGNSAFCLRYNGSTWERINANSWKAFRSVWVDETSVTAMIAGLDGWILNGPAAADAPDFAHMQNYMHIYSTNQDLDPDYPLGRDKIVLCKPMQQHWTVGRRRTCRASDSQDASGASNSVAE